MRQKQNNSLPGPRKHRGGYAVLRKGKGTRDPDQAGTLPGGPTSGSIRDGTRDPGQQDQPVGAPGPSGVQCSSPIPSDFKFGDGLPDWDGSSSGVILPPRASRSAKAKGKEVAGGHVVIVKFVESDFDHLLMGSDYRPVFCCGEVFDKAHMLKRHLRNEKHASFAVDSLCITDSVSGNNALFAYPVFVYDDLDTVLVWNRTELRTVLDVFGDGGRFEPFLGVDPQDSMRFNFMSTYAFGIFDKKSDRDDERLSTISSSCGGGASLIPENQDRLVHVGEGSTSDGELSVRNIDLEDISDVEDNSDSDGGSIDSLEEPERIEVPDPRHAAFNRVSVLHYQEKEELLRLKSKTGWWSKILVLFATLLAITSLHDLARMFISVKLVSSLRNYFKTTGTALTAMSALSTMLKAAYERLNDTFEAAFSDHVAKKSPGISEASMRQKHFRRKLHPLSSSHGHGMDDYQNFLNSGLKPNPTSSYFEMPSIARQAASDFSWSEVLKMRILKFLMRHRYTLLIAGTLVAYFMSRKKLVRNPFIFGEAVEADVVREDNRAASHRYVGVHQDAIIFRVRLRTPHFCPHFTAHYDTRRNFFQNREKTPPDTYRAMQEASECECPFDREIFVNQSKIKGLIEQIGRSGPSPQTFSISFDRSLLTFPNVTDTEEGTTHGTLLWASLINQQKNYLHASLGSGLILDKNLNFRMDSEPERGLV